MNKIGFCRGENENPAAPAAAPEAPRTIEPRKSVVQVSFPGSNKTLAYYNDSFDLHPGDLVFVEGSMAGIRGRVVGVNCNFRIRLSDYRRVIALVDTEVHGQLFFAGSHLVTFDPSVIPAGKIRGWFLPPSGEEEEYASGSDDGAFPLDRMNEIGVPPKIASRGHDYYMEERVRYLSLDGTRGYAIVEGSHPYEVEFEFSGGMISSLTCSCFCSYNCKHEFAALLQLRETLEMISNLYGDRFSGYFAAIQKGTFVSAALEGRETGSITLQPGSAF